MGDRVVLAGLSGRRVSTLQGRRAVMTGGTQGTGTAIVAPGCGRQARPMPTTRNDHPATSSPRRFRQLQNLSVPDNFDDPSPDAEIAAWLTGSTMNLPQRHWQ